MVEEIEEVSEDRKAWEISSVAEIVVPPSSNLDQNPPKNVNLVEYYGIDVDYFKEKGYSFAPLPHVDVFYNVETDEINEIDDNQYIDEDTSLIEVIKKMRDYSFLLYPRPFVYLINKKKEEIVSSGHIPLSPEFAKEVLGIDKEKMGEEYDICNTEESFEKYPSLIDEILKIEKKKRTFKIIVLSDLNKRLVKEAIYPYIISLENLLGKNIKRNYPESTPSDLLGKLNSETVGSWKKAKIAETDVHISEYMSLSEMEKTIEDSEYLISECGFSSKEEFREKMNGIVDLRNKIMSGNSNLVLKKEDVKNLIDKISRIRSMIKLLSDNSNNLENTINIK